MYDGIILITGEVTKKYYQKISICKVKQKLIQ